MQFYKYHGIGNDFIVVDFLSNTDLYKSLSPKRVKQICSRRFGVGADGILAILPPKEDSSVATMVVHNADGSIAEMCGNGIRCVALYLANTLSDIQPKALLIDTGAGQLSCAVTTSQDTDAVGSLGWVSVSMGKPKFLRQHIPMIPPSSGQFVSQPVTGIADYQFTAVNMGNPHVISFVTNSGPTLRTVAETIGPQVEVHNFFPERTNVEFAHIVSPTEIELVVWERGCGITQACGTGACATVAAACLAGHCQTGTEVTVNLLGGPLTICITDDYTEAIMNGPAQLVYTATLRL